MTEPRADEVASVRAFNRLWTTRIGALSAKHAGTPYSLTEARVLYETAQAAEVPALQLRQRLDLDAGYLSRILTRFREAGLVAVEASEGDARRQVVRLTKKGRRAFAELDARAVDEVRALLAPLSEADRRKVVAALDAVLASFVPPAGPRPSAYVLRPPRPGDLGWVVQRHGAIYAEEYGWDARFEGLVARVCADYVEHEDPRRDTALFAEMDGAPVGCVFCVKKTASVAQLRLLLVEPRARGLGIGARLVGECIAFARAAGYRAMTLWTNDVLVAARRIYERAGFELEGEERHRRFGPPLVGQTWHLDLR